MTKLSPAQIAALKMVAKRDWPAGEPRENWFQVSTFAVLMKAALVELRQNSEGGLWRGKIVDLTAAGRLALEQFELPKGKRA